MMSPHPFGGAMELPIATLLMGALLLLAWASPTFVAAIFVIATLVSAYAVTMALLARRS